MPSSVDVSGNVERKVAPDSVAQHEGAAGTLISAGPHSDLSEQEESPWPTQLDPTGSDMAPLDPTELDWTDLDWTDSDRTDSDTVPSALAVRNQRITRKYKVMKDFNVIAKLPEVVGAVLSDTSGALLDWSGNIDGEVAGAAHAFSVRSLSRTGELLGLGNFQRVSVVGPTKSCVITLQGEAILGTYVDPTKPLAAIEKKLHDTLHK